MLALTSLVSVLTVEEIFSLDVTTGPNHCSSVCFRSRSPAKPSAWIARTTVASEVFSSVAISIAVCSITASRFSLM